MNSDWKPTGDGDVRYRILGSIINVQSRGRPVTNDDVDEALETAKILIDWARMPANLTKSQLYLPEDSTATQVNLPVMQAPK